jgi:hypothetical protein
MWADAMKEFRPGERVQVTVDRDRNGKFNSLFHLCLGMIAKAINRGPATTDIDQLKKWVKLQKGWYTLVRVPPPHHGWAIDYKSTSFAAMSEEEFHQFATDACNLIRDDLAPWISDAPEFRDVTAIIDSILQPESNHVR